MKSLLFILFLVLTQISSAQNITQDLFITPVNTGVSMIVVINTSQIDEFVGGQIGAFYDLDEDGILECVGVGLVDIANGFFTFEIWGNNSSTPEKNGLDYFDIPNWAILYNDEVVLLGDLSQFNGYVSNDFVTITYIELHGCTNEMYIEYYENQPLWPGLEYGDSNCNSLHVTNGIQANMFVEPLNTGLNMSLPVLDGLNSFVGGQIAAFHIVDGDTICVGLENITESVTGFSIWGDDSTTPEIDGLLLDEIPFFAILYNGVVFSVYLPDFTGYASNGIVSINQVVMQTEYGCSDTIACIYLPYALSESCEYPLQFYNCDGNCINDEDGDLVCDELEVEGCMNENYVQFSSEATDDNGTCLTTWQQSYIDAELNTINFNLSEGWNMISYSNRNPINVADGVSDIEDILIIIKNNNADFYMPEYGFNGIGNFEPGQGYQMKITESYDSFSFQNPIVFGCMDENADNFNPNATHNDGSCYLIGCSDFSACNFYPYLTIADDSICEYPEQGYDCEGNELPQYQVGDFAEGGIVYYLDETGQHGLVAALENLDDHERWGCIYTTISGADGLYLTGYQNTLDIIAGCSETPIAASEALAYESEGYSDWYLPSILELEMMENIIGNAIPSGPNLYWSSSEYNNSTAWAVNFFDGNAYPNNYYKSSTYRVRVIRAF